MKTNIRHKFVSFSLFVTLLAFTTVFESSKSSAKTIGESASAICNRLLEGANASVQSALATYKSQVEEAHQIQYYGVDGKEITELDVYNVSSPFKTTVNGQEHEAIAGRVEARNDEANTVVWFFKKIGLNKYQRIAGTPEMKMQDPFTTKIDGQLILGGVVTWPKPDGSGYLDYQTVFFSDLGKGIAEGNIKEIGRGPMYMKDIRLLKLTKGPNAGKIFVATRPQDKDPAKGGRGKIATMIIDSLADLTPENLMKAEIIHGQVPDDEWIGANELYELENGDIGFLAHIARYEGDYIMHEGKQRAVRSYYPVTFTLSNPVPKLLLTRSDLPLGLNGPYKFGDLKNVVFSSALVFEKDGTVWFICGGGDAASYIVRVAYMFESKPVRYGIL